MIHWNVLGYGFACKSPRGNGATIRPADVTCSDCRRIIDECVGEPIQERDVPGTDVTWESLERDGWRLTYRRGANYWWLHRREDYVGDPLPNRIRVALPRDLSIREARKWAVDFVNELRRMQR